jgi:phosphoglycerol transferase MdoB-like AlkP superfamily enzyme
MQAQGSPIQVDLLAGVAVLPVQALAWWWIACATAAAFVVARWAGGDRPSWRLLLPVDLVWLVVSLLIKQSAVFQVLGSRVRPGIVWISMSAAVVFAIPLLLVPGRRRPWASWTVNAALSLFLLADVVYIRYFEDLPSLALLGATHQTWQVKDSILALIRASDLWLFADLLPAAVLFIAVRWDRSRPYSQVVALVSCLLLLIPGARWAWQARTATSGLGVKRFTNATLASQIGILGFHLQDAADWVGDTFSGITWSGEDWAAVLDILEERRPQRAGIGEHFGVAEGLNLLMVQVEALQGPVVGLKVSGQEVTPTLNRLARDGIYLSLCLDQTGKGRTSDAELLSQASLHPARRGSTVFRHSGNVLVGLAGVLGERGYSTLVAIPFRPSFWNRRYSHPALGFATRLYDGDFEPGPRVGWGLNDRDFLRQVAERLPRLEQPFCAFLITLSNHHPFTDFPDEFRILRIEDVDDDKVRGYLHSMRWADEAIGDLLAGLEEAGLADSTVVAVWGDHDSGLFRNRQQAAVVGLASDELGLVLHDRVPVIIRVPGTDVPKGILDVPTGLADVPPTLAALLAVDPAPLPWLGRNLLGAPADEPVLWGNWGWASRTRVHLSRNAPACFDASTGEEVALEECAEGSEAAMRLKEANDMILEGNLQVRLRAALGEHP